MINIQDKSECCGCYACYNICPTGAIRMEEDPKGFKYPVIDKEKCINCAQCKNVCPILKKSCVQRKDFPKAYACKNKNEETRIKSSSGGVFTLLANVVLEQNGVVFGAKFDERNNVIHSYIENKADIGNFRGSKYLQSNINECYKKAKEFLENDRYVLFTGTPCQIEGLITYLKKDYKKLYTQDIICHGVPSPKVWRKYLDEIKEKKDEKVKGINFRKKDNTGWNCYQINIMYDKTEYIKIYKEDIYMQLFLNDIILRDSCYNCQFKKKNRVSDITLADFWGIKNIKPEMDDDRGTSLVIINSDKGDELLKKIESEIEKENVDFEEAIKYNPSMTKSAEKPEKREVFFRELDNQKLKVIYKKHIVNQNIIIRVIHKIKKIIKKK